MPCKDKQVKGLGEIIKRSSGNIPLKGEWFSKKNGTVSKTGMSRSISTPKYKFVKAKDMSKLIKD